MKQTCYQPKYFKIPELVSKDLYNKAFNAGIHERLIWSINKDVLITLDLLREKFGPIVVNNWASGGSYTNCGLRSDSSSVGAVLSLHKRGMAMDCHFTKTSAPEVRKLMRSIGCDKPGFKDNCPEEYKCFKLINRVEDTENGKQISWFHFDIGNIYSDDGSIIFFGA